MAQRFFEDQLTTGKARGGESTETILSNYLSNRNNTLYVTTLVIESKN